MSDKLKVKVSIADRVYPLTISPDQEEGLRKATKKIEELKSSLQSEDIVVSMLPATRHLEIVKICLDKKNISKKLFSFG